MSDPTSFDAIRSHYEERRERFTATQHELFQHVARMGDEHFRDLLQRSQSDREGWEDAMIDYITALVLLRATEEIRLIRELRAAMVELCQRAYNLEEELIVEHPPAPACDALWTPAPAPERQRQAYGADSDDDAPTGDDAGRFRL